MTDEPEQPEDGNEVLAALQAKAENLSAKFAEVDHPFAQALANGVEQKIEGIFLHQKSAVTTPQAELLDLARDAIPHFQGRIGEMVNTLRFSLQCVDPLSALAFVAFSNVMQRPDVPYFEPTHHGSEAHVEFIAGLVATVDYGDTEPPIDLVVAMQRILQSLDGLFADEQLLLMAQGFVAREEDPRKADDKFKLQLGQLHLRGTAYVEHALAIARSLYPRFDDALLEQFGFTYADMEAVIVAADEWTSTFDVELPGDEYVTEIVTVMVDEISKANPEHLELQSKDELERVFTGLVHYAHAAYDMTFTVDDLMPLCGGVHKERVQRVLDALSFEPGSVSPKDYFHPLHTSPLHKTPFAHHRGRYILPVPGAALREIHTLLAPACNLRLREPFAKASGEATDDLAVESLVKLLPGSQSYLRLDYTCQDENGRTIHPDLDGLVIHERTAFIVEAKAKEILSEQARRGDITRLRGDLKGVVQDAAQQAVRARDHIVGGGTFTNPVSGDEIHVDSAGIDRYVLVVPSLYDLGGFSVELHELAVAGLVDADTFPWVVSIADLMVVADLIDNPAVFLHFLEWRLALPPNVVARDECDLLGEYFFGRTTDLVPNPDAMLFVQNSTTDFDTYFITPEADRRPEDKPGIFLPPHLEKFLARLQDERPDGWYEASAACLDLNMFEWAWLEAAVEGQAKAGRPGLAFIGEHDMGRLTIVIVPRNATWQTLWRVQGHAIESSHVVFVQGSERDGEPHILWALRRSVSAS